PLESCARLWDRASTVVRRGPADIPGLSLGEDGGWRSRRPDARRARQCIGRVHFDTQHTRLGPRTPSSQFVEHLRDVHTTEGTCRTAHGHLLPTCSSAYSKPNSDAMNPEA